MASGRATSTPFFLLATSVVLAPLASGGWKLEVFPIIALPVVAAWVVLLVHRLEHGRSLSVPLVSLALGLLALFTALQNAPLGDLLAVLSPRTEEVWRFVAPERIRTVSYEAGATWREAAKMALYGLAAAVAHEIARRRGARKLLQAVVLGGVASVAVAFAHRVASVEKLWGVLEAKRPASSLATTFQNPNHASGFLTLTALVAIGLAVEATTRKERSLYFLTGAGLAAVSVAEPSKGGVLALAVGLCLFGGLLWRRGRGSGEGLGLPVLFAALLLPLAGVIWRLDDVIREFGLGANAAPLGLGEKLAAVRDAWPIVLDHPWLGIGRGAYVSVYPHYQSSQLQLTFTFPENFVAQLTSEWGLVVGGAAALGLVFAVVLRVARAEKPAAMGAAAALGALLVHDLVDFALEMPGVALPFAVLVGALAPRRRGLALELRGGAMAAGWALLPMALLLPCTWGAFRSGDLQSDLEWLRAHAERVASGAPVDNEQVLARFSRHPANVLVAAQVAYIREVQTPPDIAGAMSVVNRALFLGPKYGDAHFLAARLLLRSGHRQQALEELRAAWSLTRGRRDVVGAAARWARTSEELLEAVPRSDPILEVLDAQHVARLVSVLVGVGEVGRARAVLSALPPAAELPGEALQPLSRAALRAGMPELALVLGRRAAEVRPGDAVLDLTLAQLARRAGRTEEARRIARAIDPAKIDPQELFGLRLRLAIEAEDFDAARDMVGELRRRLPVTRDHQTRLALQEASLHLAEGRPDRAVTVLGRAVDWSPADVTVRLTRARALLALGRRAEARVDLEFVLRRQPQHSGAKRLLREARPSIDATVTPEDESRPGRSGSF